jgi:Transposase DDE domain group 1
LTVRGDAGFWNYALLDTLTRLSVCWSVTVAIKAHVKAAIDAVEESAWTPIVYPDGGHAEVAETEFVTGRRGKQRTVRLVVRRTRLTDPAQLRLWPDWRHHAFITNLDKPTVAVDEFHRDHATVELAIRDLKAGAGLEHCPSGRFFANAAWLACAVLAHNLTRWTARLGHVHPPISSPSPVPSAPACSPSPAGSSTAAADSSSASQHGGRGQTRSTVPSARSAFSR